MVEFQRMEFLRALNAMSDVNRARAVRFHVGGIEEWSALEWAGAMAGEAGECANACKKLRRMQLASPSKNNFPGEAEALDAIGKEIAGTFIYLDLLAARLGINLGHAIIAEFNRVSDREGFPEKL